MQMKVDDIDQWGVEGIAERIIARVGMEIPVYLSNDIDVRNVVFAPATGIPEAGDWSNRRSYDSVVGTYSHSGCTDRSRGCYDCCEQRANSSHQW